MVDSIFIISLLLISATLAILFQKRIEECFLISISGIILILYISGLFTTFIPGIYFIYFLIILSLVVFGIIIVKKGIAGLKNYTSILATPGLVAYLFFFCLFWYATRGKLFTVWDEFSHWGLVIKNELAFHDFGNVQGATTIFRGYPPATSLLVYFYSFFAPERFEEYAVRAMALQMISCLMIFFRKARFKEIGKNFSLFVICFILPIAFNKNSYFEIYVDILLGLELASILVSYYVYENSWFKYLNIGLGLSVLCLTKASGVGLSCIFLLIVLLDIILGNRRKEKTRIFGIGLLSVIFGNFSWKLYLKLTATAGAWNTSGMNRDNILSLWRGNLPAYRQNTINAFIEFIETQTLTEGLVKFTFISFLLIFSLIIILLIRYAEKETAERIKIIAGGVFAGAIIYGTYLLLLYLFTYTEYEAQKLASAGRYLTTYLTAMLTVVIFFIVDDFQSKKRKTDWYIILTVICLCNIRWFQPLMNLTLQANQNILKSKEYRGQFDKIRQFASTLDFQEDRIYIISQNNTAHDGMDYYVTNYEIAPIPCDQGLKWSLGGPYREGDIWYFDCSVEEWSSILKEGGYTYLYIHNVDQRFIDTYQMLFLEPEKIQPYSIFQIQIVENDFVRLQFLE